MPADKAGLSHLPSLSPSFLIYKMETIPILSFQGNGEVEKREIISEKALQMYGITTIKARLHSPLSAATLWRKDLTWKLSLHPFSLVS